MLRATVQKGDTYWIEKNHQRAGLWFAKAAEVSQRFEDSDHPDVLNSVSRAYLRYASWLVSESKVKLAKKYLKRAMEVLCLELRLRNHPVLSNLLGRQAKLDQKRKEAMERGDEDPDSVVVDKNEQRYSHAMKLLALVFSFLGYIYDVQGSFERTLECNKMAVLIASAAEKRKNDKDHGTIEKRGPFEAVLTRLLFTNEERYKQLVEEKREIERVLEIHYWRFHVMPGIELTVKQELTNIIINEAVGRLYTKLRQEKAFDHMPKWVNRPTFFKDENESHLDSSLMPKLQNRDSHGKKVTFSADLQDNRSKSAPVSDPAAKKYNASEAIREENSRDEVNRSQGSIKLKARKLKWSDENNNYRYKTPIKDHFDDNIFMSFKKYHATKEFKKRSLNLTSLNEDRFWLIREKNMRKAVKGSKSMYKTMPTNSTENSMERLDYSATKDVQDLKETLEMDNYFKNSIGNKKTQGKSDSEVFDK